MMIQASSMVQHFSVLAKYSGQRIDNHLLFLLKGVPKSHIYQILRTGQVRVNAKRVSPHYRIQAADMLRIPPVRFIEKNLKTSLNSIPPPSHILEALDSSILYEDKYVLVVNKPAWMASHGGSGIQYGLIEAFRFLYPQKDLELVHRLDQGTSGCILISKKRSFLRHAHAQLREKSMEKTYKAIVYGQIYSKITIRAPLYKKHHPTQGCLVSVSEEQGLPSCTYLTPLEHYSGATLVNLSLETGRTHQIRVHCAHIGHPILGDKKYGNVAVHNDLDNVAKRLCLHAHQIKVQLPDEQMIQVEAPLPKAFLKIRDDLLSFGDR